MILLTMLVAHAGLAFIATISFLVLRRYISYAFSPLHKLPGPRGRSFWWGVFFEMSETSGRYLGAFMTWWEEAGGGMDDVKLLHYTMLLGRSYVLVLDKEIVKTILTTRFTGNEKPRFGRNFGLLKSVIGDGLVTLEGEDWLRHRRILQPSFNTSYLQKALNVAVPPKMERFIQAWNIAAEIGAEIDPKSHLVALTLDVVGEVAYSHDFHGIDAIEKWSQQLLLTNSNGGTSSHNNKLPKLSDPFLTSIRRALTRSPMSHICQLLDIMAFNNVFNLKLYRSRRVLDEAVDQVIVNALKCSKTASSSSSSSENGRKESQQHQQQRCQSLLQLMVEAQDPETRIPFTGEELRGEVKTFFAAGQETTASWCYWIFFALAMYPSVQERVYQDVIRHVPSSSASASTVDITVEDAEKMDYMNAFLHEVLRMYSPLGFLMRTTSQAECFAGYDIPAGTPMVIPMHLLHRHPKYWDNPESFQPERWLNMSPEQAERQQGAFFPFSMGIRQCIGERMAIMEVQMVVSSLVRAFRVELAPSLRDKKIEFSWDFRVRVRPDFKIVVKKR